MMSGSSAQRRAQSVLKGIGVAAHLTLVDQAFFVLVHELDRIFDGDDVVGAVAIHVIHHAAEGGGFTATGGPVTSTNPLVK